MLGQQDCLVWLKEIQGLKEGQGQDHSTPCTTVLVIMITSVRNLRPSPLACILLFRSPGNPTRPNVFCEVYIPSVGTQGVTSYIAEDNLPAATSWYFLCLFFIIDEIFVKIDGNNVRRIK